jgi:hypothetical protein
MRNVKKGRCRQTGKIRYKNMAQATAALKLMDDRGMGAYQCPFCHRYHIGHQWFRAADRITQLLAKAKQ